VVFCRGLRNSFSRRLLLQERVENVYIPAKMIPAVGWACLARCGGVDYRNAVRGSDRMVLLLLHTLKTSSIACSVYSARAMCACLQDGW
jgi:hypothetical protein